MTTLDTTKYFIRPSLFNLVELSLLARMYEEHCMPSAQSGNLNKESVAQTLLKMKATENIGELQVAIFDTDPVGFFWSQAGKTVALWVHPEHRNQGIEERLQRG